MSATRTKTERPSFLTRSHSSSRRDGARLEAARRERARESASAIRDAPNGRTTQSAASASKARAASFGSDVRKIVDGRSAGSRAARTSKPERSGSSASRKSKSGREARMASTSSATPPTSGDSTRASSGSDCERAARVAPSGVATRIRSEGAGAGATSPSGAGRAEARERDAGIDLRLDMPRNLRTARRAVLEESDTLGSRSGPSNDGGLGGGTDPESGPPVERKAGLPGGRRGTALDERSRGQP